MDIIQYLILIIQHQYQQICWLIHFICKYIPLKQWAYDDTYSPKYQKYKTDKLPIIKFFEKQNWSFLLEYYLWKYNKSIKPIQRRNGATIPENTFCPTCDAPHHYIYDNNKRGQFLCKICDCTFVTGERITTPMRFHCPYCGHCLSPKKDRKFFRVHKCINKKCSFYLNNLKNVDKKHLVENYGKNRYKLHYIYREFTMDFFKFDLDSLPSNTSSLRFKKYNPHIMSLCLTMHVNLQLSLRKTSVALFDLYGIKISHQQVANYARVAAMMVKPFVDCFDYEKSDIFVADETYIKVNGIKGYVWFVMDALSRSILGYQVSDNRGTGPCILAMRMAFRNLKKLSKNFRFIADGYSAYPLAAQQFFIKKGKDFLFNITHVIGLTNDDEVSTKYRPYKQKIERMNRTFKSTYRVSCGYGNFEGANYNVALWVAYYNFLRPHRAMGNRTLNKVDELNMANNMPGKWQILIALGQQTILNLEKQRAKDQICS